MNKNKYRKGQISTEYLIVSGFIFASLAILLLYAYKETSEAINLHQAEDAVLTLISTADSVYSSGEGSQDFSYITIPGSLDSFTMNGRTLTMEFEYNGRKTEVSYRAKGNLTGTIPTTKGSYRIRVRAVNESQIEFLQI